MLRENDGSDINTVKPRMWLLFVIIGLQFAVIIGVQIAVNQYLLYERVDAGESLESAAASVKIDMLTPPFFILMKILPHVATGLVIVFFAYLSANRHDISTTERLGILSPKASPYQLLILALGSILMVIMAGFVGDGVNWILAIEGPTDQANRMQRMFGQLNVAWGILFIAVIGIFPGFFEELAYRGFLQRGLMQRMSPLWAIVITAMVFGLVHITPRQISLSFVMALWLGVIAWKMQSIWPAVIGHFAANSSSAFYEVGRNIWNFPDVPPIFVIVIVLPMLIGAWVLSVRKMFFERGRVDWRAIES